MHVREREEREAKRSRESGNFSGARAPTAGRYGSGYMSPPYYFSSSSSHQCSSSFQASGASYTRNFQRTVQQTWPELVKAAKSSQNFFEYGNTLHMVRDCPILGKGAPPQTSQPQHAPQSSQALVTTLVATPPAQPARGGGRKGRGHLIRGGQARCYTLPARTNVIASDSIITCIVLVCQRDTLVLFDPGSTYSYVSYYFAMHLGVSRDSSSSLFFSFYSCGRFSYCGPRLSVVFGCFQWF